MQPAKIGDLDTVFSGVLLAALTLAGITVLVMLVVGGFKYLSAGGDKEAAQKASRTISYAIAGLVLTLSAWILMSFLGSLLGVNFAYFSVCLFGFNGPNCI